VTHILKVFFQNEWRRKTEEELDKEVHLKNDLAKWVKVLCLWMKVELEI